MKEPIELQNKSCKIHCFCSLSRLKMEISVIYLCFKPVFHKFLTFISLEYPFNIKPVGLMSLYGEK